MASSTASSNLGATSVAVVPVIRVREPLILHHVAAAASRAACSYRGHPKDAIVAVCLGSPKKALQDVDVARMAWRSFSASSRQVPAGARTAKCLVCRRGATLREAEAPSDVRMRPPAGNAAASATAPEGPTAAAATACSGNCGPDDEASGEAIPRSSKTKVAHFAPGPKERSKSYNQAPLLGCLSPKWRSAFTDPLAARLVPLLSSCRATRWEESIISSLRGRVV